MAIKLYDLAGANEDVRFSPFCWRVRFALAQKGLHAETIPVRFTDKDRYAFSGQGLVPVLIDGERVVNDSWDIARYLDEAYPNARALLPETLPWFLRYWTQLTIQPMVLKLVIMDVYACIHEKDREYFRASRETRFGKPLESVRVPPEQGIPALREALAPLRAELLEQPYLGGELPDFRDYMAFSPLLFARLVSPLQLIDGSDPLHAWHESMLDAFGGLARRAPRADLSGTNS
jgi:glutathione S-transferase